MKRLLIALSASLLLGGCASYTTLATARLDDGTTLRGTTTASLSGGKFEVAEPAGGVKCTGTYDAFDTNQTIQAPLTCSDGGIGNLTVVRTPDLKSGVGKFTTSTGRSGIAAFGDEADMMLAKAVEYVEAEKVKAAQELAAKEKSEKEQSLAETSQTDNSSSASVVPPTYTPTYVPARSYSSYSGGVYTGNCPTPESRDAAGRRCGLRSAASRPGGYDGYSAYYTPSRSYSSSRSYGGTTHVRGYYRKNGTYVRSHTRRSRR